ncbi:hypothetical protein [Olleya sp. R77988]|uniref:hypothetical protein n=1 Tax=Olleya sp. R77988 TaxID=3093875 RepID=UPI0037CCB0B2
MKIKRALRLVALILFIIMACILPFPLNFKRKDNIPKNLIEQIDKKQEIKEDDINKDAFG